jgi:ribonuclease HII
MKLYPFHDPELIEAGCDEAGRGCLAGPVFAAAVILPKDFDDDVLNDSKLMSIKKRTSMREIIESRALAWGVGIASLEEIQEYNIANASYIAMNRAIENMTIKPQLLLIDGKYFKSEKDIPHVCIIKGDSKFAAIAAASVLAKTHRDEFMVALNAEFPQYAWDINKGYPTKKHREAIMQFGSTDYHRKSFRLLPDIKLFDEKPAKKKKKYS